MRPLVFTFAIALAGCAGDGLPFVPADEGLDGGRRELNCDAGDCLLASPPPDINEGAQFTAECIALIDKTCMLGDALVCEEAAGCVAAQVLAEFAPDRCLEALENPSFPACAQSACETLVDRTCGQLEPDGPCETSVGCAPARTLMEQSTSGEEGERTSAERSCGRSLEDEVFFPSCAASG